MWGFSSSECGVLALGSTRWGWGMGMGPWSGFQTSNWDLSLLGQVAKLTVFRVVTTPSDGAQGSGIQMDLLGPRQSSLLYTRQGYLANQHKALVRCGWSRPLKPAAPPGRSAAARSPTCKSLSVGSRAGLGWGAGWAQHGGEGAPLFDSGDHVDRREGEDAGGGGSGREGHGGGSGQRGARGHDSGAGRGGTGSREGGGRHNRETAPE